MLFEKEIAPAAMTGSFVPAEQLAEHFAANPDPVLAELGGTRVDFAVGLDRTMYQLEVRVDAEGINFLWSKAETTSRRPRAPTWAPLPTEEVPVTPSAAVESLCQTFGLQPETVWKDGVDLLAFWEGVNANERLELPLSRDWRRYSLSQVHAH